MENLKKNGRPNSYLSVILAITALLLGPAFLSAHEIPVKSDTFDEGDEGVGAPEVPPRIGSDDDTISPREIMLRLIKMAPMLSDQVNAELLESEIEKALNVHEQETATSGGSSSGTGPLNLYPPAHTSTVNTSELTVKFLDPYGVAVDRIRAADEGDPVYVIHVSGGGSGEAMGNTVVAMIPLSREPDMAGFVGMFLIELPDEIFVPFNVPHPVLGDQVNAGKWLAVANTSSGDLGIDVVEIIP